jgi:type IV secretory pathway protease TraF
LIKRLLFLPNEKFWIVKFTNWCVVSDEIAEELYKLNIFEQKQIVLKSDEIWVQGDNSEDSFDSRNFGPILVQDIIGVVVPWRENTHVTEKIPIYEHIKELHQKGIKLTEENIYQYEL